MVNDPLKAWLQESKSGDNRFIKIPAGEKFECVFISMSFEPTGGYQNNPTVKYELKDLVDEGTVKTFNSSSKILARKMSTLKENDRIAIVAREENGRKKYDVLLLDTETKEEEGESQIPF